MLLVIVPMLATRDMILVGFSQKKMVVICLGLNMILWFQGMQKNKPSLV